MVRKRNGLPAEGTQERKVYDAMLTHEFMTVNALAKKIGVERNSVTSACSRLRKAGWAIAEKCENNPRAFKYKKVKTRLVVPQGSPDGRGPRARRGKGRKASPKTIEDRILREYAAIEKSLNNVRDMVTDIRESTRREVEAEIMASLRGRR